VARSLEVVGICPQREWSTTGSATEPGQQRSEVAAAALEASEDEMATTHANSGIEALAVADSLSVEVKVREVTRRRSRPAQVKWRWRRRSGWMIHLLVLGAVLAIATVYVASYWQRLGSGRRRHPGPERAARDAGAASASGFCRDLHGRPERDSCCCISRFRGKPDVAAALCVPVFLAWIPAVYYVCAALTKALPAG